MDAAPDTQARSRLRGAPALLVGAGVVIVALVVVIALLAINGGGDSKAAGATPSASPSPSASKALTVNDIYKRVGPSVVVIQTAKGALGTGVITNASGAVTTTVLLPSKPSWPVVAMCAR